MSTLAIIVTVSLLYHVFERLTRCGFSNWRRHDSFWRTMEIRHVCAGCPSDGFYRTSASCPRQAVQGCRLCPSSAGACRDFDGGSRSDAARIGGVGLQTIRDWVLRFNAKGPEGLKDGKAPGQPSLLKDEHRRALAQKIEYGPNPAADGVVRWRLIDLAQWIFEDYRISVTKKILSRELRAMGYRKLSARPRHHAQDAAAVPLLKRLPCRCGGCRREDGRQADRNLVRRRGSHWPEE